MMRLLFTNAQRVAILSALNFEPISAKGWAIIQATLSTDNSKTGNRSDKGSWFTIDAEVEQEIFANFCVLGGLARNPCFASQIIFSRKGAKHAKETPSQRHFFQASNLNPDRIRSSTEQKMPAFQAKLAFLAFSLRSVGMPDDQQRYGRNSVLNVIAPSLSIA